MKRSGPYNVMRNPNDWENVPRDPATIGAAIITGLGGSTALAGSVIAFKVTVAMAVGYVATSLVTSWAMSALAPKPDFSSFSSSGIMVNASDPVASADFVYGEIRKGGVVTFYEETGENNKFLHQVIVLAYHEIDSVADVFINDKIVAIDSAGNVTSPEWTKDGSPMIRIKKVLGDQTAAEPSLLQETSISSSFVGHGVAYLYVRYAFDRDVFASGLPLVTALVRGKKVYDPRTGSTAYSNNAALCVRDFITSEYGLNDQTIDDVSFAAAANESDELVSLADGNSEKRYTANGIVKSAEKNGDVLGRFMTACAGSLFRGTGQWKLKVGVYSPPVKVLTLDDLRSAIRIQTRVSMRDNFNAVRGTFNNAAQGYITADYPETVSDTFKTEDGGDEVSLDLPLPFTTSSATAQRIAKLTLFRGREQMTITADFGLEAFGVEAGDIVAFTNDRYGFDEKQFEVVSWRFGSSQEAGDLIISLTLRETSAAAFDWDADEIEIISNNTNLPDYSVAPAVGISVSDELRIYHESVSNVASLVVSASQLDLIDRVEVQFKKSSSAEWIDGGQGDPGTFEINAIDDGEYDFRARSTNVIQRRGAWAYRLGYIVDGLSQAPADINGFGAEVIGNSISFFWSAVPDLDLSYYSIRHATETSGATWANSSNYIEKVARPATDAIAPAKAGTFLIKAVDKMGIQSESAASVVVSSNEIEQRATVVTVTENPNFDGAKSGVVKKGGNIILGSTTLFDSIAGNVDDIQGLWDDIGINATGTIGTYYFDQMIVRGVAEQGFVTVDAKIRRNDSSGATWDDLGGFIDFLPGLWDDTTGVADFDDTNVVAYVSTTPDDPAGSPTWSAWQKIRAANVYGRGLRFKVELKSDLPGVSPAVSELGATANYL